MLILAVLPDIYDTVVNILLPYVWKVPRWLNWDYLWFSSISWTDNRNNAPFSNYIP